MSELAYKFSITKALASHLIRQYKRDPEMLTRQFCKEEIHDEKVDRIRSTVQDLIDAKKQIWSIPYV